MLISRRNIALFALIIACVPFFFYFSMFILSPYIGGDQLHYRNFYYFAESATLYETISNTGRLLGAIDVIYPVFSYFGATAGIDKDVYFSLFNVILMCLIVANGIKYKCGMIFIFLALTNSYTIVLLTGAERLKFAFIFLLIASLASGPVRLGALLLAPLAHFQTLIFYATALPSFISMPQRVVRKSDLIKGSVVLFTGLVALVVTGVFFGNAIVSSGMRYADRLGGVENIAQVTLLLIISQIVLKDRLRVLLSLFILIAFVAVLGGSRVNMMAVFFFVATAAAQGRASHPLVLLLMGYFSIRSIDFIENILVRGNGFDWG